MDLATDTSPERPLPSVGYPSIDDEHRVLMSILEQTAKGLDNQSSVAENLQQIEQLFHYLRSHFSNEEAFLAQERFPDLDHHRAEHAAFMERVVELHGNANKGRASQLCLLFTVKDLLVEHVAGSDMQYAMWLLQR